MNYEKMLKQIIEILDDDIVDKLTKEIRDLRLFKDGYRKFEQGPTEAVRTPVNYRYDALVWDFVKALAEIAHYSADKYGDATNYQRSVLEGNKSPMNHVIEHYREYMEGIPHDHFGNVQMQLAAIAYNAMMEWYYVARGMKGDVAQVSQRIEFQNPSGHTVESLSKLGASSEGRFPIEPNPVAGLNINNAYTVDEGSNTLRAMTETELREAHRQFMKDSKFLTEEF